MGVDKPIVQEARAHAARLERGHEACLGQSGGPGIAWAGRQRSRLRMACGGPSNSLERTPRFIRPTDTSDEAREDVRFRAALSVVVNFGAAEVMGLSNENTTSVRCSGDHIAHCRGCRDVASPRRTSSHACGRRSAQGGHRTDGAPTGRRTAATRSCWRRWGAPMPR